MKKKDNLNKYWQEKQNENNNTSANIKKVKKILKVIQPFTYRPQKYRQEKM